MNMKAIGVIILTQSAITFPGKAHNVVLNGRTCCVQYSILHKVTSTNTLRAYIIR